MGELFKNCYECGKTCINGQFSLDGDSPNSDISLPRTLKIKVIANPAYWGFSGTNDDNVMVSGYAYFSNGYYDFFYGFEEDHIACRTCGAYQDEVCAKNDQRPDIGYRAVLSEDGTLINYNGNTNDGVTRGGAEVFLIDRSATQLIDNVNCGSTDPETIFKKNPDNYGFGNKILFKDSIYKNITGAWRMSECYECYSISGYNSAKFGENCNQGSNSYLDNANQEDNNEIFLEDGYDTNNSKQNIRVDDHFGEFYDPAKRYCTNHLSLANCIQDGAIPSNYTGELISLTRELSTDYFLQAKISYSGQAASGIKNGDYIVLDASGDIYDGGYYSIDILHFPTYSLVNLFGTYDSGNPVSYIDFTENNGNGTWQIYNTLDSNSCCGGAAYGINNETKRYEMDPPYHVDIKKVFNNDKNKLYSNREKFITGQPREDHRYIETSGGIPLLDGSNNVNYVGEFSYYGPYYEADIQDTLLRTSKEKKTVYQNGTCYTKSQELMIFPDSFVQSYEYESCTEGIQHRQNIVPRLTFVYKPCNYNDNCSFNASGHPMTAGASGMPSTLEDLKAGFGGQEIVMHINLGTAWGKKVVELPDCGCYEGAPPGKIPVDPEVNIKSPVTFPCMPKFDLRPNEYGCEDPMWYNTVRNTLGIDYQGQCTETPYDACWIRQPYTTYGYIRNLCGYRDNSRVGVLQSLSQRQPTGNYTDVSGSGEIVEPMYVQFNTPIDLTGSGYAGATNGVSNPTNPYWGLTDSQGRLAFPYFRTKLSTAIEPCCPDEEPCLTRTYVDFDSSGTLLNGFPTSGVPFLIEIDHEDYCVGCSTSQIENKQYYITIESLPASYLHGTRTVEEDGLGSYGETGTDDEDGNNLGYGFKYGFNYCKYPGIYAIPEWRIDASGNEAWYVPTGCGAISASYSELNGEYTPSNPWTGETCGCLGDGITVPLRLHKIAGTDMPKYWSTDGGVNSYVPFPSGCSEPRDGADEILQDYTVYFAAFVHCGYLSSTVPSESTELDGSPYREYGSLSSLYNCGGCSHSYPATESKPNLSLDFWYVRKGYEDWFEGFTDSNLTNEEIIYFLENGATFGFLGPYADTYTGPILISSLGEGSCGSGFKDVMGMCVPYSASTLTECTLGSTDWEAAATYGTTACTGYRDGSRLIRLSTTLPDGCYGSTITLYGYSYFNTQSPTVGTDGGFNRGYPHVRTSAASPSGCCEVGCYLGEDPGYTSDYYSTIPEFLYSDSYNNGCTSCSDYALGCQGQCGGLSTALDCYGRTDATCCRDAPSLFGEDGSYINRPRWTNACYANGQESAHEIGSFAWYPSGNGCDAGWYGTLNASHAEIFFRVGSDARGLDASYITAWSASGIPGLGNITKAPAFEPMARRASQMSNVGVSTCNFDSGPNNTTYVASEFARVKRLRESFGYDSTYTHMGPVECTKTLVNSVVGATCVRPIYPNTIADIATEASGLTTVAVNKETCHPEIMTVHRVECSGNGYALHVSREYYEHDRQAYAIRKYTTVGPPTTYHVDKFPIYGELDGGRQGVLYENPTGEDNPDHFFEICNTGGLDTPPNNILGLYDYPIIIPMMSRSDYNNPCYADGSGETCVYANEPFYKSLCTSYYDPSSYNETSGAGASGYFQTDASGTLTFVITSSGSGYVYQDENLDLIPCARAIFDNPCVALSLFVESGEYSTYGVSGYAIDFSACNDNYPACCDDLSGGDKQDCQDYNDPGGGYDPEAGIALCIEGGSYSQSLPTGTIWPVSIIGCDAEPIIVCDTITDDTCGDLSPIYPNFYNSGDGTILWNYYNLVYDSGDPDSRFLSDAALIGASFYPTTIPGERPEPFPVNKQIVTSNNINPGFVNGSLLTNQPPIALDSTNYTCTYSCIRDNINCGGEFFTNKEFLPRRKYAIGTKVTRYGPLSVCAQTAEHGWGNWLSGHVDLTTSSINTKALGNLNDVRYLPLVDPSRSGAYTVLTSPMSYTDDIIYVEDLTTLLGAKHPFFKMLEPQSLDNKSCIMPDSGCFNFLPTHNTSTAFGMEQENFFSGDDVYYTNREIIREAIASGLVGTSGCLLNPFKIMVDVEPCSERLGHPGTSDPMNLSWVVPNVTAGVCRGWLKSGSDSCSNTCDNRIEAIGLKDFFGCTEVGYYTCTPCDNPEGATYSWGSPVECDEPAIHTVQQRFIFTGMDGVVYLSPIVGTTYSSDDDVTPYQGKWVDASCKTGMGLFPPNGPTASGYGHDCSLLGEYTYIDGCGGTGIPFEYFSLRKYPDDYWTGISDYDEIFCAFLRGSTDFELYKASGGPIRGYRDMAISPSCGLQRLINEEYGCYTQGGIQECPYPSVLKVTITE